MKSLKEQISNLSDGDLLSVWREVCDLFNLSDSEIFENDEEFFEIWGATGIEVARSVHYGDYRYSDDYVHFDGYGNLESSNRVKDFTDEYQIIDCVNQNPDSFTEWFEIEEVEEED